MRGCAPWTGLRGASLIDKSLTSIFLFESYMLAEYKAIDVLQIKQLIESPADSLFFAKCYVFDLGLGNL